MMRPSTEPTAKKVPDRWKATTVTGRLWPALLKEAVFPVDVGSDVFLVDGVVSTVTGVPVDAGPDIVVPVDVGSSVVPAGMKTGTVRDI